jgi:XisI protein
MERPMEKIKKYQEIVIDFLKSLVSDYSTEPELQDELICDCIGNHFQLLTVGWQYKRYVFIVNVHIDIKDNGKIWILANNTDILVAEELRRLGVPSDDIVLGLKSSSIRQHTGYAVA